MLEATIFKEFGLILYNSSKYSLKTLPGFKKSGLLILDLLFDKTVSICSFYKPSSPNFAPKSPPIIAQLVSVSPPFNNNS